MPPHRPTPPSLTRLTASRRPPPTPVLPRAPSPLSLRWAAAAPPLLLRPAMQQIHAAAAASSSSRPRPPALRPPPPGRATSSPAPRPAGHLLSSAPWLLRAGSSSARRGGQPLLRVAATPRRPLGPCSA
ncbi:hypothetical protein PVAP13_8NG212703 [Panicum virgatum]|uniref:Uncharacterized protein n=1 Tax=Panicum virgatum TaxID=38727 RepID=A0A8T0P9Q7_PANVG|nr:hypothetical protein PVAP13_8NG212703 [Panicum virgatum]